jgi:hypothetical protein
VECGCLRTGAGENIWAKKGKVTEGRRKLHTEELHSLTSACSKSLGEEMYMRFCEKARKKEIIGRLTG